MVTATKEIAGHPIVAQTPTIYSRVFRSVLYRNLTKGLSAPDLNSLSPVLGQLATEYITLIPVIVASKDNPAWVATESMNPEETKLAFYDWIQLPETDYTALDDLFSLVTAPANDTHLTPEGKAVNPTN